MNSDPARIWLAVGPAMVVPFCASLFYFVLFSQHVFARVIYAGTKVFTLVWPLLALACILRGELPRLSLRHPKHVRALAPGILCGLAVVLLMLALLQTPLGTMVEASAGRIGAKAAELGILNYYWPFALFLSLLHSLLEEYYWRWFLYGRLREVIPEAASHLLAGTAFAAHHIVVASQYFPLGWAFILGGLVGVGGVLFSVLYAKQQTLAGAWVCHLIIDLGLMTVGHHLIFGTWV